ncbi:MAG: hypothetical protein AAGA70_05455 [Pseudomonadota bacterium]
MANVNGRWHEPAHRTWRQGIVYASLDPMRFATFLISLLAASTALAAPRDVAVGDPLRRVLLDAIRPQAEELLAAPVVFRVIALQIDGDRAFGQLYGERPGGVAIEMSQAPVVVEEGWSLDMIDGPRFEVFYHFTGGVWEIVTWEMGSTDAWWFGYDCANYGQFYEVQAC